MDVRLTMGGEPTFVSIDDPDGAEWNTAAMGPTKRRLASALFKRMKDRYAPAGLAHFGQGKWYPGEQLPRWSLNCYWRRDGEPIWTNPHLSADENLDYGASEFSARRFLDEVAARLDFEAKYVFPAYEDAFYYLWRERRLPVNVDPFDSRLEDPLERARLATRIRAGPRPRRRVRPSGGAHGGRPRLADRSVVPAQRALLPDSRRLADRLPAAARFTALDREGRLSLHPRARSHARFQGVGAAGGDPAATARARHGAFPARRGGAAGARAFCRRDPHLDVRRGPPRRSLRLHAAGAGTGSLPRIDRRRGGGRRKRSINPSSSRATNLPAIRGSIISG